MSRINADNGLHRNFKILYLYSLLLYAVLLPLDFVVFTSGAIK